MTLQSEGPRPAALKADERKATMSDLEDLAGQLGPALGRLESVWDNMMLGPRPSDQMKDTGARPMDRLDFVAQELRMALAKLEQLTTLVASRA